MILRSLTIENFRQFYDRQTLEFSTDTERNVTLIYGSNGSGKTTLLNAFTWGLYGSTTAGFDQSEWLICNLAWEEADVGQEVSARVEIEFEDDGKLYSIERVQTARKGEGAEPSYTRSDDAKLHVTDESGRSELHASIGAIRAILPERLHRFVFFDGERGIERLTDAESYSDAEDAVKTVLGLEVVERAIEDLASTRRRLNADLSDVGSERDKELGEQITKLQQQHDDLKEKLALVRQNLASDKREFAKVEQKLAELEESHKLQRRREELEQAVTQEDERIRKANDDIADAVQREGFLAFVEPLAERIEAISDEQRQHGRIPAAITMQLVQDLLRDRKCICGTELREGEAPHEHVTAWLKAATPQDVQDSWTSLSAQVKINYSSRDNLYRHLHDTLGEREVAEAARKIWDDKRSEITKEIGGLDSGEVQQLEERRNRLKSQIADYHRRIALLEERDIAHLDRQINELQREQLKAHEENKLAALARRRVAAVSNAGEIFKQILQIRSEQTRAELDSRIKDVFNRICRRPFVPSLGPDFRLTLGETIGGRDITVARSTGESQILGLSFVGAVAERARERYAESRLGERSSPGLLSFEGGVFPLVLDAVFGNLDDEYQLSAAEALPELAPQVIVMVSRTQGKDAVREALWPRAGKIAVCTLYTSEKKGDDAMVDTPSGAAPYIVEIDERRDRTELVEL